MAGCSQGYWLGATGVWRCQRDARCRDRRSRCMEMRRGRPILLLHPLAATAFFLPSSSSPTAATRCCKSLASSYVAIDNASSYRCPDRCYLSIRRHWPLSATLPHCCRRYPFPPCC
ncbi:hypothetical protein GW17_00025058 [Ensete ventricosum]|nr:hypothetical protein GW17_00025058 [Ensete ventricosum]